MILDVVFNHTAEGGAGGPTFSLKGFANEDVLPARPRTGRRYVDASGTGNTLNANGTIVRRMILDSLRYWVARDARRRLPLRPRGRAVARRARAAGWPNPPTLWDIETDPVLAGTKLIAEAWDAGGLYEVGNFVGDRWAEWNGVFRDDVRRFVRSDPGRRRPSAAALPRQPRHLRPRAAAIPR